MTDADNQDDERFACDSIVLALGYVVAFWIGRLASSGSVLRISE